MKGFGVVAAGLALCLYVNGHAGELWEPEAALQAAVSGPTDAWRTRLNEATTGSPEQIRATLAALSQADSLTLPARERVLYDYAFALRLGSPGATQRAAMEWLAGYDSQVLVPREEGGGQYPMPLYPVATAAAGTRSAWRYTEARIQTLQYITNKDTQAVDLSKFTDPAGRRGAVAAFREASPAALRALGPELLARTARDTRLASVTAVVAQRLNDAQLYQAVLASTNQEAALGLLPEVVDRFPPEAAFALLQTGLSNRPLASASLLQMARLQGRIPAAEELLFSALNDRELGGSAAAALARTGDPAVVRRVDDMLAASDDRLLQARAVLALQLDASDPALRALERFRQRTDVDHQLRKEVEQWLEK